EEELGCQQHNGSALVAELERMTQLILLEQWGKRLALTDEGRELYAHAQHVVVEADEAWRAMAEQRGIESPESVPLRVAADTTVGTYVMLYLVGDFQQRRPAIALHLRVSISLQVH